jgi:hypothetical protein
VTSSEAARHARYARLGEVLGEEHADTLMTSLPMETAGRLATKDDIDRLEQRFERLEVRLDARMQHFEERMDARFTEFAAEIRADIREMRQEAHTQFRNYTITMVGAMTALTAIFGVVVSILG